MKKGLIIAILIGFLLGVISSIWVTFFRYKLHQLNPYIEFITIVLPIILTQIIIVFISKTNQPFIKTSLLGWTSSFVSVLVVAIFFVYNEHSRIASGLIFVAIFITISIASFCFSLLSTAIISFLKEKIKITK